MNLNAVFRTGRLVHTSMTSVVSAKAMISKSTRLANVSPAIFHLSKGMFTMNLGVEGTD